MRKILFISLILFTLLSSVQVFSQDTIPKKRPIPRESAFSWDKFFVGGNLGLQFGTVTFIDISPLIGYRFTEKFSAGTGITYRYYSYNDKTYNFSTSVYGGRVFGRYFILENLFAHTEYESLSLERFDLRNKRIIVNSLLAGGGYRQALGERSFIELLALWNFNESVYSPYTNPIIRVGFNIGL